MTIQRHNRQTRADRLFNLVNGLFMALVVLLMAYPLYFILIASFSDPTQVNAGRVILFPRDIMFDGFRAIFKDTKIWMGYRNTITYAVLGTILNVSLTLTAGYSLSRKELMGRKLIMKLLTFTMFFNGGMIPNYLLVAGLGLKDTLWAMILPNAVSVWNLIIARTYLSTNIPDELFEAASMDGCGTIRFFFRIVLPLSSALTAVMVLFYAVAHWNAFFNALIYLESSAKYPLQLVLRNILLINQSGDSSMLADAEDLVLRQKLSDLLKYGVIVVSTLPVLCIYPFVQKYFVKGVMIGAVKG